MEVEFGCCGVECRGGGSQKMGGGGHSHKPRREHMELAKGFELVGSQTGVFILDKLISKSDDRGNNQGAISFDRGADTLNFSLGHGLCQQYQAGNSS